MKDKIKELGKYLINNLGLDNEYDVMTKWMITYIAEQMYIYENGDNENEKQIAGEKASDAIIKFWKHRPYNPGWDPLEKYREIIDKLGQMIFRESNVEFINFLRPIVHEEADIVEKANVTSKVASWLIENMFLNEFDKLIDPSDDKWIDIIDDLGDSDAKLIRILSTVSKSKNESSNEYIKYRIEKIVFVKKLLEEFAEAEQAKINE